MSADYRSINRAGWAYLATHGSDSSKQYGPPQFRTAREYLDPRGWIPWSEVRHVLCLASAGGQQASLFACLNCRVVSADISPEQLKRDREVANRYNLSIECVETDMLDLEQLYGRDFDLVYQAVSACYVPDVRRLYAEVAQVVRPGGYYQVEHWNPAQLQLPDNNPWNGRGYVVARPMKAGQCLPWRVDAESEVSCLHYLHTMNDLIGGLCDAGFGILGFTERDYGNVFAEPGSDAHLAAYLPAFFLLFAQRKQGDAKW